MQRIHIKHQALSSSKEKSIKKKERKVSSAAVLLGSLRVKCKSLLTWNENKLCLRSYKVDINVQQMKLLCINVLLPKHVS